MKKNVYERAREVARELVPVLQAIRDCDKSLADQLKRAARRGVGVTLGMRGLGSLPLAGRLKRSARL